MRFVSRAASFPTRVDWSKPENLMRVGILTVVIIGIVAALLLRDNFRTAQAAYGAVALSALVPSSGLLIPVPALATACLTATYLNPFLVSVSYSPLTLPTKY